MGASIYLGKSLSAGTKGCNIILASTPPPALLLDTYPNASVAYSLRQLRTAYTGAAIRVRRSSDNAEQDINFVGANLDTASLLTFCGAGNGFVTTWYDQSGNARNATQTTAGRQSRIVLNGVVELLGNKPCLNTFAANVLRDYQISYSNLLPLPISIISAHKIDILPTNSFNNITFNIGGTVNTGGGGRYQTYADNTNIYITQRSNTSGSSSVSQSISALSSVIICSFFKTTDLQQRLNGVDSASVAYSGAPFATNSNWNILNASSLNQNFHGAKRFYEIIIFESDQSANRTGIETNINNYYNIYP
jgi:hypothetical protein